MGLFEESDSPSVGYIHICIHHIHTIPSRPPIMDNTHFVIGPEAQKSLRDTALGQRFLRVAHSASRDTVERQEWPRLESSSGPVIVTEMEEELEAARWV